jgi:hypothetical protein
MLWQLLLLANGKKKVKKKSLFNLIITFVLINIKKSNFMKKQLLFIGLLLGSFFSSNAQVLESENYDALTIGNVGTNLAGTLAGQGGIFTLNNTGGTNSANSNYQIVGSDFTHLNVLQLTSSNAATGDKDAWKNGLNTAWNARTAGNDVIELEVSFFTGAATTSTCSYRPLLYGTDGKVIGGFSFNVGTKRLDGFAYGDFNATGTPTNYIITLRTNGLILPTDTWVRVGFAYNTSTGVFRWKCNDVSPVLYGGLTGEALYNPDEFDHIFAAGTLNAVAATILTDDVTVTAKATESLLSNDKIDNSSKIFATYPNPTKDIINVTNSTDALISTIEITDLNGRVVKNVKVSNATEVQISVSDLAQGVYTMKIVSDKGTAVKKIIKE